MRARWIVLGTVGTAIGFAAAISTADAKPSRLLVAPYPYAHECPAAGYADRLDRWLMSTCNCTSFAAWALARNGQWIDWFVPGEMDAKNWPAVAKAAGIRTGSRPRPEAVAVWPRLSPPYGHLAYVTMVHADGSFDVAEYNLLRRYGFDERTHIRPRGAIFVYVPRRKAASKP